MIRNYIAKQANAKQEIKKIESIENKNDIITSDF